MPWLCQVLNHSPKLWRNNELFINVFQKRILHYSIDGELLPAHPPHAVLWHPVPQRPTTSLAVNARHCHQTKPKIPKKQTCNQPYIKFNGSDYFNFTVVHNRPLALRGHVTNASFKQWVIILLMPKIDRAHKNYLTPEIWEETHLREIFYGTLIFQQSSMICMAAMLEGILLPSNMAAETTFCLYHVKRLIVMFRCAITITTSSFQHFSWSLRAKFGFRKRQFIILKIKFWSCDQLQTFSF